MTKILCVDIETCSAASIRNGNAAYSEHESTRVWCVSFGIASTKHEKPTVYTWTPGQQLPKKIAQYIERGGLLLAHNAGFEMAIWRNILAPKFGWPLPKIEQWRDTQAVGVAANLPVSLEGLAKVFKGSPGKDMTGNKLMRSLAVATWNETHQRYDYPDSGDDAMLPELRRLIEYCEADVLATLFVWWRLPPMHSFELNVWHIDQRINQRGVGIDQEFVEKMANMAEMRKDLLATDVFRITGSLCANSTNPHALKLWLKDEGIELPVVAKRNKETGEVEKKETLAKDAVEKMLDVGDLEGAVYAVLDNRIEANKSASLAKLKRVPQMVSKDGRLRGALRYSIAHTGRWAGSGIQVHNLPKDKRSNKRSEHVRGLVRKGALNTLLLSEERPLDAMSQSLRAMLVAAPGKDLIAADYSAIEARVLAWLADAKPVLDIFDAGGDVYVSAAATIIGKAVEKVTKQDRQLGKVCTLALGYQMGVLKFIDTARRAPYWVTLDRKEAYRVQRAWRDNNPEIVAFWKEIEEACQNAVGNKGTVFEVGPHLKVRCNKKALMIQLPSGRVLRYWRPQVKRVKKEIVSVDEHGELVKNEFESMELQFFTVGKNKSRMTRESTYGGKLTENVTQAVARDLLAYALVALDSRGFDVVLHVHDSAAAEVDAGTRSVEEFCRRMGETPKWAAGCPVATEGYRSKFFKG